MIKNYVFDIIVISLILFLGILFMNIRIILFLIGLNFIVSQYLFWGQIDLFDIIPSHEHMGMILIIISTLGTHYWYFGIVFIILILPFFNYKREPWLIIKTNKKIKFIKKILFIK